MSAAQAINLRAKVAKLDAHWSPRVIGELDDHYAKVAKLKGSFTWHKHDDEDELFLVIDGRLKIEFEDHSVDLGPGEMCIVPRGVLHNPVAAEECSVLLIEKKSTQQTGDNATAQTKSIADQLRPL
ncbi:cupin domain-containing protein [Actomonas aquatica]|uniref:Cupin domain-containing protein n=1 Tax=Actomonas aquatica TaxID=2866162 RepID=A0ABZ1C5J9_9BACT|nr:cupin domain-containing protein [Opitutus sp. WL0086]WRQ87012.1 cupin domain-containing protein [Opitutus sp. WL0086]